MQEGKQSNKTSFHDRVILSSMIQVERTTHCNDKSNVSGMVQCHIWDYGRDGLMCVRMYARKNTMMNVPILHLGIPVSCAVVVPLSPASCSGPSRMLEGLLSPTKQAIS
eukprot:GHVS01049643.1.p1 GENE.GHVS01049643.1~~GHVS01049643.1.p1  ORF type:complete len:109 (+),score=5.12 GHVS01049643.1:56-382(+)